MQRKVFVDGYNVIRRDPSLVRLERSSLELARDTLLTLLNGSPKFRHDDVTVVFDGAGSDAYGVRGSRRFRRGRLQVIFSAPGQSADEVIKRLVAESPPGCLVVTDDREIRDSAGVSGSSSANLMQRDKRPMNRAPRANGTWVKDEEDGPRGGGDKKGNGRKAPKKRNRSEPLDW